MAKYKYILTVIITLCSLITYAQPAQYTPMAASGYQMKRLKVDSTLHLPSFCGVPTIRGSVAKEGALAIDTCGALLYMWTRLGGWDTVNVSGGGGGGATDTTSLSNRINLKVNISDTASMLSPYLKEIDTASLSNRINLKLNISDTTSMLNSYLRKIDTTNKFVNNITRTPGKDSIIFFIGGNRFAIKDSVGSGGGGAFLPLSGGTLTGNLNGTTATFSSSGSSNTFNINHTSGSGHALEITKAGNGEGIIVNKTSGSGNAVTITGTLNATTLVKNGGTSSQFLKADGSVDATTYVSDTTALQRKSISAYTILANNTNATANVSAQAFKDTSGTYSGTITWTGTTAPSGATNHSYRLTQVGKCVTLHISLVFATNGAGLTAVLLTLPSGAPTPVQPAGLTSASTNMYPVNGQLANAANSILSSASRGFLRNNSAGNGFEILINFATSAPAMLGVTLQYWTN